MIIDIAKNAITALGLVPDEDVHVSVIKDTDWNGTPKIVLMTEPTKVEDIAQTSIIAVTTPLTIYCLAETRQEAWNTVRQAAHAVYQQFTELERQRNSGVFCITLGGYDVVPVPERTLFQANVSFNLLHPLTL